MRRGWVIAGALVLAAVPAVPVVAAAGVSLVIERLPGAGGDVQRFRVRLDGVGKGVEVAVAVSPAEALTEVTCAPETALAGGPEVPVSDSDAAGAVAMRALTGGDSVVTPGVRVCALGKVAGERAVEVAVTAPAGDTEVVLAAVARLRDPAGGGLTTVTRTAAVQGTPLTARTIPAASARPIASARPMASARPAAPTRPAASARPMASARPAVPATPTALATPTAVVTSQGAGGVAVQERPSATERALLGATERVRPRATERAAVSREGQARGGVASPGPTVAVVTPQPLASSATQELTAPLPSVVPQISVAPLVSAAPLPSVAPSALFSSESGEAPWPWDMAMSTRPVEPAGWVSPIDGPRALPMVAAGIAVLLGALWLFVTVQRGGSRRKVL
ncbi:hypothetical protein SAMN05444920_112110 [Nonomuraea solani]|uniref:Uncharacterized protein n=1 Tax=Nonomuraea solani TaxID=1144553 RepID=A0A1H6EQ28_9ACTN|nr:hypothetical protein [Nonomuraea solani]SEG98919.1 hypothetical protein SAMN05444920_112110 [Nonomuraea solani]